MQVKKFEARSMQEALKMVKRELGPEAIILAARDISKKFGLMNEASIEITAAVSEHTLRKKKYVESRFRETDREKFNESSARSQKTVIEKAVQRTLQPPPVVVRPATSRPYITIDDHDHDEHDEPVPQAARPVSKTARPQPRDEELVLKSALSAATEKPRQLIKSLALEAKKAGLAFVDERTEARPAVQPAASAAVAAPQRDEMANLQEEIKRLQALVTTLTTRPQSVVSSHPGAAHGIPYEMNFMFEKLVSAGLENEHVVEILKEAQKNFKGEFRKPHLDAFAAQWILSNTKVVENPFQNRMHLFYGMSGAGKTSSLVKMASHCVIERRESVAILTTDTMKVGAADQLRIFSRILNVPFAILRSPADWAKVLNELGTTKRIFVDFPSLNLRDLNQIDFIRHHVPPATETVSRHLVIPATTKDRDCEEIVSRFKVSRFDDLIFTSLDQSTQHGVLYNLSKKTGIPLHSFGIGSHIPEDFELATKERVLDLIFKLTRIRSGRQTA